eukprot:TRINITY_DN1318_c0_g1_i1.p1 TRINITY_DN1318_c0_g1~~TRINITY_DN1318_c0_g1_i1.p1  ORF type:complete len:480 (+),score=67.30 TRINITY_DN1318_c0_g1_i1:72-1511(+)
MNIPLLDPRAVTSIPDHFDGYLLARDRWAKCCSFNRTGSLLAVGSHNGQIIIWDFETRVESKRIQPHVGVIRCVCFDKTGRFILSGSEDMSVCVTDILTDEVVATAKFESPILTVQYHPQNSDLCLVCLVKSPPFLVNFKTGKKNQLPLPNVNRDIPAVFNFSGDVVFAVATLGLLSSVDTTDCQSLDHRDLSFKVPVKQMTLSPNGASILMNCTDATIRNVDINDPSFATQCADRVAKLQWVKACFSTSGSLIVGGAANKEHRIYMFDSEGGTIYSTLDGPRDGVHDLLWHPQRPLLVSVSTSDGMVYIWSNTVTERWSAYAPDFEELEENREYVEKENDLDDMSEDERVDDSAKLVADVLDIDGEDAAATSDFVLPVIPIPDDVMQEGEADLFDTGIYMPIAGAMAPYERIPTGRGAKHPEKPPVAIPAAPTPAAPKMKTARRKRSGSESDSEEMDEENIDSDDLASDDSRRVRVCN